MNELLEDVDSEVEIEDEDREDLQKELKKMNDDIADWLIDMEEDRWNEERHLISKAREVLDLIQDVSDEYRLDIDPVPNPERDKSFMTACSRTARMMTKKTLSLETID